MTDQSVPTNSEEIPVPTPQQTPHHGILEQTLGEILESNPHAQNMIKKSMGISDEKFQEMLTSAQQNNLMHMTVRDLFSNGIVQQAVNQQQQFTKQQQVQVTPEQMQQLQEGKLSVEDVQSLSQQTTPQQSSSFLDKVKEFFK